MGRVFVIAEIGINHNGDLGLARKLIDMAIRCGCDAVKFQKRTVGKCYTKEFLDSLRESPWGTTQREQKNGLEFGLEYAIIDDYCRGKIDWFASAWDIDSQLFLRQFDLKYNKVASKMVADEELLKTIAEEGKHTFISTGLNDDDVLYRALDILGDCPFTLMHCVMKYPCPAEECNLREIQELKTLGIPIGYSSHFPGVLDKPLAVLLGAEAIESHITLDRTMYGSDQSASLEERGLQIMVRDVRNVNILL